MRNSIREVKKRIFPENDFPRGEWPWAPSQNLREFTAREWGIRNRALCESCARLVRGQKLLKGASLSGAEKSEAHGVHPHTLGIHRIAALNKNALADLRGRERSPVGGAGAHNVKLVEKRARSLSPKTQELAPETRFPLPPPGGRVFRVRISAGNRPETSPKLKIWLARMRRG